MKYYYDQLTCEKESYLIEGKHNDFIFDGHPVFEALIDHLDALFKRALQ